MRTSRILLLWDVVVCVHAAAYYAISRVRSWSVDALGFAFYVGIRMTYTRDWVMRDDG